MSGAEEYSRGDHAHAGPSDPPPPAKRWWETLPVPVWVAILGVVSSLLLGVINRVFPTEDLARKTRAIACPPRSQAPAGVVPSSSAAVVAWAK